MNFTRKLARDESPPDSEAVPSMENRVPLDAIPKGRWERSWPTIACGAGLFSDGYLNGYVLAPHARSCQFALTGIAPASLDL